MTGAGPEPLRIYLIRHGATEWALTGRHTGLTDIPLTAHGEDEARALGRALYGLQFTHAFTSPRQRARRTAELVDLGPPIEVDPDLAEWDYGAYEGRRTAEIRGDDADWNLFRDGCPQGEAPAQVLTRVERLFARLRSLHGNVALFSHGQISGVLVARWIGLPVLKAEHFPFGTAALAVLEYAAHHPEVPVIARWNWRVEGSPGGLPRSSLMARERWEDDGGAIVRSSGARPRRPRRLVIFDLDGTLAVSKAAIDPEMAGLLGALLRVVKVAVISGGDWPQFQAQLVSHLPADADLRGLSLLPTCGTKFYRHTDDWELLYSEQLGAAARAKIVGALTSVSAAAGLATSGEWGETIEDRGTQITFSALGQAAPIEAKRRWDPDFARRKRMKAQLAELIPEFSVRLGGTTSIDVTRPGIDKAHGIRKLRDVLGVAIDEMLFIGDALFPGGNDEPAREAGVVCVRVRDSEETKRLIETLLACL